MFSALPHPAGFQRRSTSRELGHVHPYNILRHGQSEHGSTSITGCPFWCKLFGISLCTISSVGGLAVCFLAPWWWTCNAVPGLEPCGNHASSAYSCWYDLSVLGQHCRNKCGLEVSEFSAWDRQLPAFNGSRLFLTNSSACAKVAHADQDSMSQAGECAMFCVGAMRNAFLSPLCWTSFDLPYVCLRSQLATWARKVPGWGHKAIACAYTVLSVCKASQRTLHESVPKWRWAASTKYFAPLAFLEGPEQVVAQRKLHCDAIAMLLDRLFDVNALSKYLRNGEIWCVLCVILSVAIAGDPLQIEALVEYRRSLQRGYVGTRGLAIAMAHEGAFEGACGVLIPAASILSGVNMDFMDVFSLIIACFTSLHSVFSGVGGAREVAGAMASKEQMPFAAQRRIAQVHIQVLRAGEVCSLIPMLHATLWWGARSVYILGMVILGLVYTCSWISTTWVAPRRLVVRYLCMPLVLHAPGGPLMNMRHPLESMRAQPLAADFPFQVMNPKAFGLISVCSSILLWPLTLVWPGSFRDPAGECAKRNWPMQAILPAMPPMAYYSGRIMLSICFLGLSLAQHWELLASSIFHRCSTCKVDALGFAQFVILTMGALGPLSMLFVLYRWPGLLNVRDSDAAVLERGSCMLQCSQRWDAAEIATVSFVLGCAWLRLRQSKEAEARFQTATSLFEEVLGIDHQYSAMAHVYLSCSLNQQAKKDIAEKNVPSLEHALSVIETTYGHESGELRRALEVLGNSRRLTGKPQEALALYTRVLSLKGKVGPCIEDAFLKVNVARVHIRQNDFLKAVEEIKQAIPTLENILGKEHAEVAWALNALGNAYLKAGNNRKCAEILRSALPLLEAGFGPEHVEVTSALQNLGRACHQLGLYEESSEILEHVLAVIPDSDARRATRTRVSQLLDATQRARKEVADAESPRTLLDHNLCNKGMPLKKSIE